MKITHSKTGSRRSHHHLDAVAVVKTATGVRRMHYVDPVTGMYRGKQIIAVQGKSVAPVKKAGKKVVKEKAPAAKKATKEKTATTAAKKS